MTADSFDAGRLRRALAWVAALAAGWALFLLVAAAWWAGEAAWRRLGEVGAALWVATAALFAANHLLRFVRWHLMLAGEGFRIPATRSFSIFLAGLALLPTPGKAGVTVRSLLLLREGVPANVSLAAWFAERLYDLLGLVALAALIFGEGTPAQRLAVALGVAVAGIAFVRVAPALCARLATRFAARPLAARVLGWSVAFFGHAATMLGAKRFVPYLLLGAAANAVTGVLLWLAVSHAGHASGLLEAVATIAISHLSGSLSMLPGGMGGFELAMAGQLAVREVPAAAAIVMIVLVRLATLWGSVLVGLPCLAAGLRRMESDAAPACVQAGADRTMSILR